jgi:hypothetical protein
MAMGETEQQWPSRYAALVSPGVRPSALLLFGEAWPRGQLTGIQRWVDEVDRQRSVRVER